jgi:lysophospholipase L1-like esterase
VSKLRRRLAVSGLACVLAAVAAEGAVRLRLWSRTGQFGLAHRFSVDGETGLRIPTPGRSTAGLELDSRGFRSPELEVPKPKGRVRLAFLGGSTTFCAEVHGNEATWPARVVAGLREAHPRVAFDWINASAGGWATDSSLTNLDRRLAPLEPDVILVYHATNDLTKDSRELARRAGLGDTGGDVSGWLGEHSMAWDLLCKNQAYRKRLRPASEERRGLDFDPEELVRPFRERLTALTRRATEIAPRVVLITFSQRTRVSQSAEERQSSARSSLYYMPYMTPEGLIEVFAAANAVVREVARAEGALLVDGEDEIPADGEHFTDSVHFTARGCEAMARRILARLERDSALQEFLTTRATAGAIPR